MKPHLVYGSCLLSILHSALMATAGDVRGIALMPPYCSPEISPAVAWLESIDPAGKPGGKAVSPRPPGEMVLMRQSALQFVPRIVVLKKGQSIQFTNEDSEFHNIHVHARGELFNQTMPPGQPTAFTPASTGILNVFCDIHQHMRAFLIVLESPWAMTCDKKGKYRFENVPAGRYRLTLWHEMGRKPVEREIEVPSDGIDLGTTQLTDATAPPGRASLIAPPAKTWPELIDRIAIKLTTSLAAAKRSESAERAKSLADSAHQADFVESGLAQAVRTRLGNERAIDLESKFRKFAEAIKAATAAAPSDSAEASSALRSLMAALVQASQDLKSAGSTTIAKPENDESQAKPNE